MTKAPRILYFSSLFPSPTHPHSGPFSLRRVQALIRLGSSVRVVCPIGLTPPKRLSLHPLLAVRWVKQERSIPLGAVYSSRGDDRWMRNDAGAETLHRPLSLRYRSR